MNEEGKGKNGLVVIEKQCSLQRSELDDFQYVQVGTIQCPIKEQKCSNKVLKLQMHEGKSCAVLRQMQGSRQGPKNLVLFLISWLHDIGGKR